MILVIQIIITILFNLLNISSDMSNTAIDVSELNEAKRLVWSVDNSHSEVVFKVRHLGISTVSGHFTDFDVDLQFDSENLSDFQVHTAVDVNSIDTGNERRDGHLKSSDFFDAAQFSNLTFVSKEVKNLSGNTFELVGDLTMKDVTKEVVLNVELLGIIPARDGQQRVGFRAETMVNRMEYGLLWNNLTETGGLVVGHEITIEINLEAISNSPS